MSDDSIRWHLTHDIAYKDLEIVRKLDSNTLTIRDLWKLKERAVEQGKIIQSDNHRFEYYGLEN